VIEHFEKELSEWTLKEYVHMLMILKGLYYQNDQNTSRLVITNFNYMDLLNQGKLQEDELKTKKHSEMFQKILA
jgi:hypothetical protein